MNRRGFLKILGAALVIPFLPKCKATPPKPVMGVDLAKGSDQTAVMTWTEGKPIWINYDDIHQMEQIQKELLDHMNSMMGCPIITNPFVPKDRIIVMPGLSKAIRTGFITDLG